MWVMSSTGTDEHNKGRFEAMKRADRFGQIIIGTPLLLLEIGNLLLTSIQSCCNDLHKLWAWFRSAQLVYNRLNGSCNRASSCCKSGGKQASVTSLLIHLHLSLPAIPADRQELAGKCSTASEGGAEAGTVNMWDVHYYVTLRTAWQTLCDQVWGTVSKRTGVIPKAIWMCFPGFAAGF